MKYPSWLIKIPHFDKLLHALGCVALYGLFRLIGFGTLGSLIIVTGIAAGKEWLYDRDRRENHSVDWWDFAAGVIPVLITAAWEIFA